VTKVYVPPVILDVDGAKVYILEITKRRWIDGKTHYLVSCFVEWRGKKSNVFTLDVVSNEELKAKLKTEVSKFKLIVMSGVF